MWNLSVWAPVKDRSVLGGLYTGVPLGQRSSRRQVLLAHNCIRNHKINRDWLTRVDAESRRGARVEGLLESSASLRSNDMGLYSSLGKHSLLTRSLQKNRFPAGGCAFYRSPDDAFVRTYTSPSFRYASLFLSPDDVSVRTGATYATLSFHYDLRIRSVLLSLLSRFSPFRRHSFLFYYFSLLLCISSPAVCGREKRSLRSLHTPCKLNHYKSVRLGTKSNCLGTKT